MKRNLTFILVLILAFTFILTSCNVLDESTNLHPNTSIDSSSTNKVAESCSSNIETTSSNIETTQNPTIEEIHYYSKTNPVKAPVQMLRSKNRLYLMQFYKQYYDMYNKEVYSLCFDPLCEHNTMSCLTQKFVWIDDCVVNDYNSRIYVTRGDNIFSFTIMGSDIRLEVSFSDAGKDPNKPYIQSGNPNIKNLMYFDNYIFFNYSIIDYEKSDDENIYSIRLLYRYDVNTKELVNLSQDNDYKDMQIKQIYDKNEIIVFLLKDDSYDFYLCDFDGNIIRKLDNFTGFSFFDGKYFYNSINTEDKTSIVKFDIDGNVTIIYEIDSIISFLDMYDDYIYFSITDKSPFFVGSYEYYDMRNHEYVTCEVYNRHHTLCRVSTKTKKCEIIFEGLTSDDPKDISYDIMSLAIIGNDFLIAGTAYQENEATQHVVKTKGVPFTGGFTLFHIDDNNKLVFDKVLN